MVADHRLLRHRTANGQVGNFFHVNAFGFTSRDCCLNRKTDDREAIGVPHIKARILTKRTKRRTKRTYYIQLEYVLPASEMLTTDTLQYIHDHNIIMDTTRVRDGGEIAGFLSILTLGIDERWESIEKNHQTSMKVLSQPVSIHTSLDDRLNS